MTRSRSFTSRPRGKGTAEVLTTSRSGYMRCLRCKADNPQEMNFCGKCGAPLARHCRKCEFDNPPEFEFCGRCGIALSGRETFRSSGRVNTDESVAASANSPRGERRQLTVMFCDLVNSTQLAEQLDPEELRDVMRRYQEASVVVIDRFEGHVGQYLGDGLLVYFGYPLAHEDDAERAVRAGLGIVAAMQTMNAHSQQIGGLVVSLQVRIGIHTGLVVAGEMGAGEYREQFAIVGETPNIAARLQERAASNAVVISAATYQLVHGFFRFEECGPQSLKGVSALVPMYRVVGESQARSRFEVAARTGLTPLIGRDQEVSLLRERWARAQRGEGQVVLLSGEPGIGKSRLVQVLIDEVVEETATRIEFYSSPYHRNSAFYPIIEHLQRLLKSSREEASVAKLSKLQRTLGRYHFPQSDTVPLLAALLSLPHPEGYAPLEMSPHKQKQKTLEALVAWIVEEARQAPVLCVWEDLQWADPSSLELLDLFIDQVPTIRLLGFLTFRSEFAPPWRARSHLGHITLDRLDRRQVEVMIEQVTRGKSLPREVAQQVVTKTDGVPLFIEECTKMILESQLVRETDEHYELTGPLPRLGIPATLHDSLIARLDRLTTAKEVAQLAATFGREFTYELLRSVSSLDEATLQRELGRLVDAEFLYQRGLPPQAKYVFKHALIQDAAYNSLLRSKRQQYHQLIARVLEVQFSEIKETQPELLAHHYAEAGLKQQAIPYWRQAGQRAIQRSANTEAIVHLNRGLELLSALPSSGERARQEIEFQVTLGSTLMAIKGYAAPEVEKAYARARQLCRELGETPQLFTVLQGLWGFYIVRGELRTARELGEQCLTFAQSTRDPALLLWAHFIPGMTLFHLGEFVLARQHFEQGITLYDPQKRRSHRALQDPGVACLSYAALVLWFLGFPDKALERSREALTLAKELSHPNSLVYALILAAVLHQYRGERRAVLDRTEAAFAPSTEHGFLFWLEWGSILGAWALAEHGEEEIAKIQRSLGSLRDAGAELAHEYHLALLADAYGEGGRAEKGLIVITEALAISHKNAELYFDAELYRLKGELLLKQSAEDYAEAEACFRQALTIARRQNAKSLELRTAMSLARALSERGRRDEGRTILAELYDWFTEGFDTADLKDAKSLLDELGA
jgi:TOMM system kinase/cyclase fusion protein